MPFLDPKTTVCLLILCRYEIGGTDEAWKEALASGKKRNIVSVKRWELPCFFSCFRLSCVVLAQWANFRLFRGLTPFMFNIAGLHRS